MRVTLPLFGALVLVHLLIGGTRLGFAIPAYLLLVVPAFWASWKSKKWGEPNFHCLLSFALFVSYVVGRALVSPVEYLARTHLYIALGAAIVYLLSACFMERQKERVWVLVGLLGLGLVDAGIGAYQFVQGNNYLPFGFGRPDYGVRASGFFVCPNHLAGFLAAISLCGAAIVCWARLRHIPKIILGYLVAVGVIGLALTGSRGGYLSLLAGLAVFAWIALYVVRQFSPERVRLMLVVVVVLIGLGLAGAVWMMSRHEFLRSRLDHIVEKNLRVELWQAAWQTFLTEPVFGTGSSTYLYLGRQFRSVSVQNDPVYVHNDYLQLLAEYGIVGAGFFVYFLGAHLLHGVKELKAILRRLAASVHRPRSDSLALTGGALCAGAACLAHSVVDFNLQIPANALLFSFIFGLLANPRLDLKSGAPARSGLFVRGGLAALGLLVLGLELPKLKGERLAEQARISLREKQYEETILRGQEALRAESRNPDLYFYLGEAHRLLGMNETDLEKRAAHCRSAVEAFDRGLKLFPQDERTLLKGGLALDVLGRYDEAEKLFQRALQADPNLGEVHAHYGLHLQYQGKLEQAKAEFEIAARLSNSDLARQGLEEIQ